MSSGRNDSSYDLRSASAIAARLRGGSAPAAGGPVPPPAGEYVRFVRRALKFGGAGAAAPHDGLERHADLSDEVPWSPEMMGSGGWRTLLDWCVSSLDADAAFIVDARGLVIGNSGVLSSDAVEETGGRLTIAFEQADQMLRSHGTALSLAVELESGWLVGLRVPLRDGESLLVGIVGPLPLTQEARRKVANAFTKKAMGV